MFKKFSRYAAAAMVATAGMAVVTESPAFAAVGGCKTSGSVSVCFNWGDEPGNTIRGDFYLNVAPDPSRYSYKMNFEKNGVVMSTPVKTGRIVSGRNCCLYGHVETLPPTRKTMRVRVQIITSGGAVHQTAWSNPYTFTN